MSDQLIVQKSEWEGWSDEQLMEYEHRLYEAGCDGEDNWFERDQVIWEMNRRGLFDL